MTATSNQRPTSLRHKILAVFFSLVIGGLGISALSLGLTHDWPLPFAVLTAALFVSMAIWNIATLDRTSEYPEGAWLLSLAALCLVTGITGLLSSTWVGLSIMFVIFGVYGLGAFGLRRTRDK